MKSYVIHFIRHGAIDETLSGKYIGATDVPLSEKGRQSLKKLERECRYPYAQVVFTSPLKRCTETCQILYPDLSPLAIANLRECSFGEWEGKTAEELRDDPEFEKWIRDYDTDQRPVTLELLQKYKEKEIIIYKNRAEADRFIEELRIKNSEFRG